MKITESYLIKDEDYNIIKVFKTENGLYYTERGRTSRFKEISVEEFKEGKNRMR